MEGCLFPHMEISVHVFKITDPIIYRYPIGESAEYCKKKENDMNIFKQEARRSLPDKVITRPS